MDSFDHQILLEKSIWLIYWLIVHLPFHLLLGANVEKTVDVRFSVFLLCSFLCLPIFQRKEPSQRLHKMPSVLSKYQFNGWMADYVVIDVFSSNACEMLSLHFKNFGKVTLIRFLTSFGTKINVTLIDF